MKKIFFLVGFMAIVLYKGYAQIKNGLGVKAGYNWSYLTGEKEGIQFGNKTGFMAALFFAPPATKGFGYRTELVFSRQGYSFDEGGKNMEVLNDYIYLPQMTTINIGKVLQLQAGGQIGFLLHSREKQDQKDTTITGLMNRFDYGFVGGLEICPFKGFMVGGRYNLGIAKLHKQFETTPSNPYPLPFNPATTNFKNGLFQIFVGYRF
ncbi:MAG TPA: porin family protein [Flavisolibacter sp.]|jgi:hypothetical protein|nr:porin family protein [Flavisolibacter sp.]